MALDSLRIKGHVKLDLYGPDGALKDTREVENVICSGGLFSIAEAISHSTNTHPMSGMGIGTGTTAATTADTNLETSAAYTALTSAGRATGATSAHSCIFTTTFNAGEGTAAITEAIICCAASAYGDKGTGPIFNRVTFAAINKQAADTLTINWTIVLSDA